jgi:hypothetical protein
MSKIILPRSETTATGAPADGETPLFETTLEETLGIRKFIEMSIADMRVQLEAASKDRGLPAKKFKQMKTSAIIVTAWLTSSLEMVDGMLRDAATRGGRTLAQELRSRSTKD